MAILAGIHRLFGVLVAAALALSCNEQHFGAKLDVRAVEVGTGYGCALLSDATVRCWSRDNPRPREIIGSAQQVEVAGEVACARLQPGDISCWTARVERPVVVSAVHGASDLALSSSFGDTVGCSSLAVGGVSCWTSTTGADGSWMMGQVYRDAMTDRGIDVSVYNNNVCVVTEGRRVRCWYLPLPPPFAQVPNIRYVLPNIEGAAQIVTWRGESWVRLLSGRLLHVFLPEYPMNGPRDVDPGFEEVSGLSGVADFDRSPEYPNYLCTLHVDGRVRCSVNAPDTLVRDRASPEQYFLVEGASLGTDISLGGDWGCFSTSQQEIKCWGNVDPFLGIVQTPEPQGTPSRIWNLPPAIDISGDRSDIGNEEVCALGADGRPYCWLAYALGRGTPPRRVEGISDGYDIVAEASHDCVLTNPVSPQLLCWGLNDRGQLGVSPNSPPYIWSQAPVRSFESARPLGVATGGSFTCALADSSTGRGGAVSCWGRGYVDPMTGESYAPRTHEHLSGFDYIALTADPRAETVCGTRFNRSASCWNGSNQLYGVAADVHGGVAQLELLPGGGLCVRYMDGTVGCRDVSLQLDDDVEELRGATQITSVDRGLCGVLPSGHVRCVIPRGSDVLPRSSTEPCEGGDAQGCERSRSVSEHAFPTSAAQVAGTGGSVCARLTDGSVWCWGRNYWWGERRPNMTVRPQIVPLLW